MKLSFFYKFILLTPVLLSIIINVGHSAEADKIITCPAEIVCSRNNSVSSCAASEGELEYWGSISNDGPVKKGKYTFIGVDRSYYQTPYIGNASSCKYNYNDESLRGRWLLIESKRLDKPIEAFSSPLTNWEINGYIADCKATDPKLCPFSEVPLIKIAMDKQIQLDIYANGIPVLFYQKNPHILSIYEAWEACTDTGLCLLHFIIKEGAGTSEIGSILLDMSDKMKVQFIYPSCGTGYSLFLNNEIPNLIEIKAH